MKGWDQLLINVPDMEGRHIQVERIEAVSGPATKDRNLSFFATPTASSTLPADRGGTYRAWSPIDGLLETCWTEGASGPGAGEWVTLTFPGNIEVRHTGFDKNEELFAANNRPKRAAISFSDGETIELAFSDIRGIQLHDILPAETSSPLRHPQ